MDLNSSNQAVNGSPADARQASSPSAKTPISSLQELCQSMGKTPRYDLMAMEGRAHQPHFVYRCTVGDITRNGQGGSKKAAKHAAAEAVLKKLENSEDAEVEEPSPSPQAQPMPSQEGADSLNPVGTLQELVVARGWRLPTYSLYAESGPAHKKEFVMCCNVESFKEYGSGTAKKHAKRSSAMKMFNKIKALPPDAECRVDHEIKWKPVSFDVLHSASGQKIQPLPLDDNLGINVCQYLQQIAERSNFSIDYVDFQDFTSNGSLQCMILLTTQPALCCHGEGANFDEAHASAARNAMRMLKIFFEKMTMRDGVKKEA